MTVAYSQQGSVAVLTVDNPPVNALSVGVRQGMVDGIERAIADPAVAAVIVIGKGKTFIAGADIREFGKPPQPPRLSIAIAALEAMKSGQVGIAGSTGAVLHRSLIAILALVDRPVAVDR